MITLKIQSKTPCKEIYLSNNQQNFNFTIIYYVKNYN